MALADEVADLLAVHYEVDAIGGQHQEAVICMVQLQQRHMGCMTWMSAARQGNGPHGFYSLAKHFFIFLGCCVLSCKICPEAEDFKEGMTALQSSP